MRTAIILDGDTPVNDVVLADGPKGDEYLALYGDAIVETTGLTPRPGVDNGWFYRDGIWVHEPA